MNRQRHREGDRLLLLATAYLASPPSGAVSVIPEPRGERYRCTVARPVVVAAVEGGELLLREMDGTCTRLPASSRGLRRDHLQTWLHRGRSLLARWMRSVEPPRRTST